MEESQVADYFVVAGLPNQPEPMDDYTDKSHLKQNQSLDPITDITVIFPAFAEDCPEGWEVLIYTPTGLMADLNHGSLHSPEVYICYKRGRDKPPLVDIGVLYENKDRILSDSEIVLKTPSGKTANVNNTTTRTFLTYRRARRDMPANELVVTDICVIIANKGEKAPHAFCVIKKNLNKGVFGSEVYLCYKKSMNRANLISYKPGILCRYPTWDRPDWKLHPNVPLFCLPMGASLEVWPPEASQPPPIFSTFVLTVSDAAEKVYGSAVTFYERHPVENLTQEQLSILEKSLEKDKAQNSDSFEESLDSIEENSIAKDEEEASSTSRLSIISGSYTVNANKCICLLSHWPFFDTFERFLEFLYRLSTTGPHAVPIERYISHFLEHVPFPSPQRPRILVQLSARDKVILSQPEDLPLPRSGAGFRDLLRNLSSEDSLLVLLLVLTEHKILVHSLRPSVLTAVVEAISMIMFPFKWQCPYIPLCPLGLAEVLHAPLPFLIGVDSRFFDMYDPPADVTCVDLDTNNITIAEEKRHLTYKLLPKRAARNLKNTLEELSKKCYDSDSYIEMSLYDEDIDDMLRFQLKEKEQKLQLEIQEAFLRFMATILKGYRSYLLPITKAPTVGATDPSSLFDLQNFLKSRDRAHHKFFVMLMKTQMFIRFIEERSFVSDMDIGLAFFDECTEKVDFDDGGNCRLLELEEGSKSERTVFIPPPESSGLPPKATYDYQGFNLDSNLFRQIETKHTLQVAAQENIPGSPMARRTKHEVKSAQKLARRKHSQSAQSWSKCLLTTCYSLWFIHLPSFILYDPSKSSSCLKIAYDLLVKIQKLKLHPTDEVCYRVMMQLCGIHSQPVLAVNLLSQMKMCGIQPNALTYGYYNRAVLEATWPSDVSNPSHLWNKLRNVIVGAALFKRGGHKASRLKISEAVSSTSISSLDKGDLITEFEKFDRQRSRVGSIMKPQQKNFQELLSNQPLESSAGILMTGTKRSPQLNKRRMSCMEFNSRLQQSNANVKPEVNASRLRRGSMSPTIPENTLKILMRSDSFANDTSILEKHNRTNKIPDQNKLTVGASKKLFVPRESSESLDITDDLSMDDSCSSRRDSIRRESLKLNRQDTPTRKFLSRITRLGSDVWNKGHWRTSQDSVDSAPACSSEQSAEEPPSPKLNEHNNGKPPWKSSEGLLTSDDANLISIREERRNQRSASESRENKNRNSVDEAFNEDNLKTTPSSSLLNSSDDLLHLSGTSSQADISCCDDEKDPEVPKTLQLSNGGFILETNEASSPSKISPVRTPVTENDPLGALQSEEDIINENELTITNKIDAKTVLNSIGDHDSSAKMKFDLSSGGLFENHKTKNSKNEDDSVDYLNKINSRKSDVERVGQGDGTAVVGNRIPKSSTFHHGKEKDAKAKTVTRGTTIPEQDNANTRKSMQRSTTMPDTAAVAAVSSSPSVASSLSHLSSSFKFSFSRYSPSRFSLKKSDLRIAKTQILENAISGSKKSNELLLSGLNSFKSAATSVAKKIEEAISANSTPVKSSNLTHDYEEDEIEASVEKSSALDFEYWGSNLKEFFGDGSRKGSSANLQHQNIEEQSVSEEVIVDHLYGKNSIVKNQDNPMALNILMTTCCKCNNCSSVLHDEEIVSGWTPDDSNLNTKCHFCGKPTLPFLSVTIYDLRGRDKSIKCSADVTNLTHTFLNRHLTSSTLSVNDLKTNKADSSKEPDRPASNNENDEQSEKVTDAGNVPECTENAAECTEKVTECTENVTECNDSVENDQSVLTISQNEKPCSNDKVNEQNFEPYILEPITVPYLNPLVLRKELENILQHEGDPSLTKPSFVDQHPIIYWNMIWVFERINVTSHLPGLAFQSVAVNKEQFIHPSWKEHCDQTNVSVKCLWDNPRLHEEVGQPMYVLWQQQDQPSELVSALITDRTALPRTVMQNVITSLKHDNMCDPMRRLVKEREKLRKKGFSHCHSLYRDILYLAIVACDRPNINLDTFDREYNIAYEKLKAEGVFLLKCDKPPVSASYRNYFKPLLL